MKEKLNEKEKKYLKKISKVLSVFAAIAKVLVTIAIPLTIISMIILFVVFNKFDYHNNTLYFDNNRVFTIEEDNDGMTIVYDDETSELLKIDIEDQVTLLKVKNFMNNNVKDKILAYIEIYLLSVVATAVVSRMILDKVKRFFGNIHDGNTPFTEENTEFLRKMWVLRLVNLGISMVVSIILQILISSDTSELLEVNGIFEILTIIVIYYVFRYGTMLQSKSKMTIYGEEKGNE